MDYIEIIHMDLMGTFPAQSAGRFYSTRVQGSSSHRLDPVGIPCSLVPLITRREVKNENSNFGYWTKLYYCESFYL